MANRDLVAIGTSAGGVEALLYLVKRLPIEFPASVLVTIHMPGRARSSLDEVLTRAGPLPARFAREGDVVKKGCIYLAPPDRHLLLDDYRVLLGIGPRENNSRPAIDAMLRSVAICCGARAIGLVLTGTLGDGASGLWAVRTCGGITVVQDPRDAAFAEMPLTALNRANPDHVVSLSAMPALLAHLVHEPAGDKVPAPHNLRREVEIARSARTAMSTMDHLGRRSVLSCPDCGGVMWEIDEGDLARYRCHVGHTYTAELMSLALDENLRRALASAQRALEERVALAFKLHEQAAVKGQRLLAQTWSDKMRDSERELKIVRDGMQRIDQITADREQAEQAAE